MRTLPILFNSDMIEAILKKRKTVTRRPVKPDVKSNEGIFIPPYQPGDILYIRETWQFMPCIECNKECEKCGKTPVTYEDRESISEGCFIYRADYPCPKRITWKPSIHMPKAAARIWLKVTDVRAEQLKDITEQQARKEGYENDIEYALGHTAAWHFIKDFERTYPACTEESWVWVIEFKQCKKTESEEW